MKIFLQKFAAFYLACFACWWLQVTHGFPPVFASAAVGFLGSFYPQNEVQGVIYAGTFAGMCSPEYLEAQYAITIVSLFGSAIFLFGKPHLNGFGGRLGAIAFLSSIGLIMIRSLW